MKCYVALAILMVVFVVPLSAQVPKGWMLQEDHHRPSDPPGPIKLVPEGSGLRAITPRKAIFWSPGNVVAGIYSLRGTFTLITTTGYREYYGLIFAGTDLDAAGQDYLSFMIADDGTWFVKRRKGTTAEDGKELFPRAPSAAVKKPDASGMCTNTLEVRVTADKIDFVINGTLVHTLPRTGQAAKTDGIYGMRVNPELKLPLPGLKHHDHLEVQVDGFGISK